MLVEHSSHHTLEQSKYPTVQTCYNGTFDISLKVKTRKNSTKRRGQIFVYARHPEDSFVDDLRLVGRRRRTSFFRKRLPTVIVGNQYCTDTNTTLKIIYNRSSVVRPCVHTQYVSNDARPARGVLKKKNRLRTGTRVSLTTYLIH